MVFPTKANTAATVKSTIRSLMALSAAKSLINKAKRQAPTRSTRATRSAAKATSAARVVDWSGFDNDLPCGSYNLSPTFASPLSPSYMPNSPSYPPTSHSYMPTSPPCITPPFRPSFYHHASLSTPSTPNYEPTSLACTSPPFTPSSHGYHLSTPSRPTVRTASVACHSPPFRASHCSAFDFVAVNHQPSASHPSSSATMSPPCVTAELVNAIRELHRAHAPAGKTALYAVFPAEVLLREAVSSAGMEHLLELHFIVDVERDGAMPMAALLLNLFNWDHVFAPTVTKTLDLLFPPSP